MNSTGAVWYRVEISEHGISKIERVESAGANGSRVYYVAANNKEEAAIAGRAAFNAYCAAKKRERVARLDLEGRCSCGRVRDIGGKNCSVCIERQRQFRKANPGRYATKGAPRNEDARVAACKVRQRDRKKEIRLETLLEVRRMSKKPKFEQWLNREIEKACAPTLVAVKESA